MCKNFPREMLMLLYRVIKSPLYPVDCLQACLDVIGRSEAELVQSKEYKTLAAKVRKELPLVMTN